MDFKITYLPSRSTVEDSDNMIINQYADGVYTTGKISINQLNIPVADNTSIGGIALSSSSPSLDLYRIQMADGMAYINIPWIDRRVIDAKYNTQTKCIDLSTNQGKTFYIYVGDLLDVYQGNPDNIELSTVGSDNVFSISENTKYNKGGNFVRSNGDTGCIVYRNTKKNGYRLQQPATENVYICETYDDVDMCKEKITSVHSIIVNNVDPSSPYLEQLVVDTAWKKLADNPFEHCKVGSGRFSYNSITGKLFFTEKDKITRIKKRDE